MIYDLLFWYSYTPHSVRDEFRRGDNVAVAATAKQKTKVKTGAKQNCACFSALYAHKYLLAMRENAMRQTSLANIRDIG